jgi:hypothetical protein
VEGSALDSISFEVEKGRIYLNKPIVGKKGKHLQSISEELLGSARRLGLSSQMKRLATRRFHSSTKRAMPTQSCLVDQIRSSQRQRRQEV